MTKVLLPINWGTFAWPGLRYSEAPVRRRLANTGNSRACGLSVWRFGSRTIMLDVHEDLLVPLGAPAAQSHLVRPWSRPAHGGGVLVGLALFTKAQFAFAAEKLLSGSGIIFQFSLCRCIHRH